MKFVLGTLSFSYVSLLRRYGFCINVTAQCGIECSVNVLQCIISWWVFLFKKWTEVTDGQMSSTLLTYLYEVVKN